MLNFRLPAWLVMCVICFCGQQMRAEDKPPVDADAQKPARGAGELRPLNRQKTVLLDLEGKRVLLKSEVVLRDGLLEMFACLKQTKEHESILAVDAKAYVIHAGLLAIGAEPGKPVQFVRVDAENPEKFIEDFRPPTGQKIGIFVQWKDQKGRLQRVDARKWVRYATNRIYTVEMEALPADLTIPKEGELRKLFYDDRNGELSWYGPVNEEQRDALLELSRDAGYRKAIKSFYEQSRPREMDAEWVFAGSRIYRDERTGEEHYAAEQGTLICVANFSSAMIDVSIESSDQESEGILFEPYTERIPPLGTEVTIELIPVAEKKAGRDAKKR